MTIPSVVQVTPIVNASGFSSPRSVVFPNPVAIGNSILFMGYAYNSGTAAVADVIQSITMDGATFVERFNQGVRYSGAQGVVLWVAENVQQNGTTVTLTPVLANGGNSISVCAIEVKDLKTDGAYEVSVGAQTEQGVYNVAVGPAPASGSVSQVDTLAIGISMVNQSADNVNVGWIDPTGWTRHAASQDSTSGKRAIFVISKGKATTDAESVTIASTSADLYGRVGVVCLMRGNLTASPPPAPPPSEPPPPPAPPAATTPLAFQFLNIDPEMAGQTGVVMQIHKAPSTEPLMGSFVQGVTAEEFEAAGSYSKVVIPHDGVVSVALGESVRAVGQNAGNTAGFRGVIVGTVIEAT